MTTVDEESLPQSWALARVRDLAEIHYGKGLRQDKRKTGTIPVYGSNGVVGTHDVGYTKGPTIILGRKGSIGAVHFCSSGCWPIDTTYYINNFSDVDPNFLVAALHNLDLAELDTSTAIPGLNRDDIYQQEIALPPLAEQKRLGAQLVLCADLVNSARSHLSRASAILKRFRQAVLDAAATGTLTKGWRRKIISKQNAKDDLETILADREDEGRLEADSTEGHEALIEAVPNEWLTPSLTDLFRFIDYRGKSPKKSDHGRRLISAKNIEKGYLTDEPVEYVSEKTYLDWMGRGFPKQGDILFVTEGHTMGFAARNDRDDQFALAQRIITLQPWHSLDTRCFLFFIMSSLFQSLIRLNATGSAAVGIKAARLRGLPIPFPPVAEQREIVSRVEALFMLADQIETQCQQSWRRVEKLTQSILAKAFRGELVPTEAELARHEGREYEPASALLKRIRADRDMTASVPKGSRRKASAHV